MNLENTLKKVKSASQELLLKEDKNINHVLVTLANSLIKHSGKILKANAKDLKTIDKNDSIYDRVLLDESRIKDMAKSLKIIAKYKSPTNQILEKKKLENGLKLEKVSVPLGVIGAIFEARPNVIIDIFALCLKSQNSCVLKGGSQAVNSYKELIDLIHESLKKNGFKKEVAVLLPNDRKITNELFKADEYLDLIIPRGSQKLIEYVRENSKIPVIETGAGVVHTFMDETANVKMTEDIIYNAKTNRPSVCNALDTLLVHEKRLKDLSKVCGKKLIESGVEIFACSKSFYELKNTYPKSLLKKAKKEHFGKEYLGMQMSVKVVKNLDEVIEHINLFSSKHSEAIITKNKKNADKFLKQIDAAAVYVNTSTRFTDGEVFGLGAEIGISTQKLHARGPMGIKELTSYKWKIVGSGQIR